MAWAARVAAAEPPAPAPAAEKAAPGRHEPYLSMGFSYYASDRRVVAGAGGGPGYRLHFTRQLAAYAEVQYLVYLGNAFRGAAGASYEFAIGSLRPFVGLQGSIYGGDRVAVISSEQPAPPAAIAWAAQVRIAPLRFVHDVFTVSALSGDIGLGIDAKTRAFAFSVALMDAGMRF